MLTLYHGTERDSDSDLSMFSFAQHYNDNGNGRLIKYKPREKMYK